MVKPLLRSVADSDASAILEIYRPFVRETAITFEEDVPSVEESRRRISEHSSTHPFLVAEIDGRVVGYAKAGPFRARAAYRWTTETAVYVGPDQQRRGIGFTLYSALLEKLEQLGFATAIGVVTLPNEASRALHARCGFQPVGTLERTGYKLGAWHDTEWWQKPLRESADEPAPTRSPEEGAPE